VARINLFYWLLVEKLVRAAIVPNLRGRLIRIFGGEIGRNVYIHEVIFQNVYVNGFRNFVAESKATVQPGCIIDLAEKVILREMVTIAQGVTICTHSNPGSKMGKPLAKVFAPRYAPVEFKKGCWVGASSTILPGITVGEMAVVGAGSVVTRDVPPLMIVAGTPAEVVKEIEGIDEDRII
jgi:acetyltransferase-like isoleucine patch superfamily enzyme